MRTISIDARAGSWRVSDGSAVLRVFARQADARRFAEDVAAATGEEVEIRIEGGVTSPPLSYRTSPRSARRGI